MASRRPTRTSDMSPALSLSTSAADATSVQSDRANRGSSTSSTLATPLPIRNPVSGPAGATDGDIVVFDSASGRAVKDSGVTVASITDALASIEVALRDADQVGYYRPSKYEHDAGELAGYAHRFATDAAMAVGERGRNEFEIR